MNAPTSVGETKDGGAHGEERGEEEKEISYNYDELKSGPEVVNISENIYLELQYPPSVIILLQMTHNFVQITCPLQRDPQPFFS